MLINDSNIKQLIADNEILVVEIRDLWEIDPSWLENFKNCCNRHNLEFFPKNLTPMGLNCYGNDDAYHSKKVYVFDKCRKISKVIEALENPSKDGARILNNIDWFSFADIKDLL